MCRWKAWYLTEGRSLCETATGKCRRGELDATVVEVLAQFYQTSQVTLLILLPHTSAW